MAQGDGASVAKSTREERAAWNPHDFASPAEYPYLGRDVPHTIGPGGYPIPKWETRIEGYGPAGLWRETKCFHCHEWLTYSMCRPCQSLMRLTGKNDTTCQCMKDTLWIYGHCEDHRRFQHGPNQG